MLAQKPRSYYLEMICADFLAGAHLDDGNPEILLNSISRYYKFFPGEQQQSSASSDPKASWLAVAPRSALNLALFIWRKDTNNLVLAVTFLRHSSSLHFCP